MLYSYKNVIYEIKSSKSKSLKVKQKRKITQKYHIKYIAMQCRLNQEKFFYKTCSTKLQYGSRIL